MLMWFWADSGKGFKASEIVKLEDDLDDKDIKSELESWFEEVTHGKGYYPERVTYGYEHIKPPELTLKPTGKTWTVTSIEYKVISSDGIELPPFWDASTISLEETALQRWCQKKARELEKTL